MSWSPPWLRSVGGAVHGSGVGELCSAAASLSPLVHWRFPVSSRVSQAVPPQLYRVAPLVIPCEWFSCSGSAFKIHVLAWVERVSFLFLFRPVHVACGILVLQPGINPGLRQWQPGVLTTDCQGIPRYILNNNKCAQTFNCVRPSATPWTGILPQEYCSGVSFQLTLT